MFRTMVSNKFKDVFSTLLRRIEVHEQDFHSAIRLSGIMRVGAKFTTPELAAFFSERAHG